MAETIGRPSKFTPEVREGLIKAMAAGMTRERAAALIGIDRSTLYGWMKRGRREDEGEFFDFYTTIKKAEATAVARAIKCIMDASFQHWQAAAWWLERTHPEDYGSQRLEIARIKKHITALERAFARQFGRNLLPVMKTGRYERI